MKTSHFLPPFSSPTIPHRKFSVPISSPSSSPRLHNQIQTPERAVTWGKVSSETDKYYWHLCFFGDVRIASFGSGRDLVESTWTPYVGNSDQTHNLCPIFSYTKLEHPHQYLVYVTLKKYFSHLSLVILLFLCNLTHKSEKLGLQILWELLIANHLEQSLCLTNQKHRAAVRSDSYLVHSSGVQLWCAFSPASANGAQMQEQKPLSWAKPANFWLFFIWF